MAEVLTPDLCVIGADPGGLAVASAAAAFGVQVALIGQGMLGVNRLDGGLLAVQTLIAAGRRAFEVRAGAVFGVTTREPNVSFSQVMDEVRRVAGRATLDASANRFRAMGILVIESPARFLDARSVEAAGIRIRPRRFVIATGALPAPAPIEGIGDVPYLTVDTITDLRKQPDHLLIVGSGARAAALAQAFARLGTRVTVLAQGPFLPLLDRELAAPVLRSLQHDGVILHENVAISRVGTHIYGVEIAFDPSSSNDGTSSNATIVQGSHLLVADALKPALDGLELEAAGIQTDKTGIIVDGKLLSSNRRVHAIGDCAGGAATAIRGRHASEHQAELVIGNALFRRPVRFDPALAPRFVPTDPEIATVGLDEDAARARFRSIRILRWPLAQNLRARADHRGDGHVKLITTENGTLLGAGIVGARAGEMLGLWSLALAKRMKAQDVATIAVAQPSLAEAGKRAAMSFFAPLARQPRIRRLIQFLRIFG